MPIFRRVCLLLLASLSLQGIFFPIPALTILDAVSNTRNVPVAPGAFVAISAPGRGGVLKDHRSEVRIEFRADDGRVTAMTAIEPPKGSSAEVFAAIPADAAIGFANIRVRAPGYDNQITVQIARASPAIFTRNNAGFGPALSSHHDSSALTLLSPAIPEEEVTLYATGLGGATTGEVSVEIAGESARILYAGPQGLAGLDQINLIVPKNAQAGCYVPVVIRTRGAASGFVTIPISATARACPHPLGLSAADLQTLESGGSIPLAYFRAGEARIQRNDTAVLSTMRVDATGAFEAAGLAAPDSVYFSCQATPQYSGVHGDDGQDDAGVLNLFGPGGEVMPMPRLSGGPYAMSSQPALASGIWQLSAAGGADIRGFSQTFRIPPPLKNLKAVAQGQDRLITWDTTGFLPTDTVSAGPCRVRASDGRMVIPDAAQTDFAVFLKPHPAARPTFQLERSDGRTMPAVIDYDFYFPVQ